MSVIDFHTHAFPDSLAERAIRTLESESDGVTAFLDGRVSSLQRSMDEAGIERSVICSIATRPSQFEPILKWSEEIRSERLIPFPSLHPSDPKHAEHIKRIAGDGYKGIKFHPYYQDFYLDEDRMWPLYEAAMREDLMVVMHTGYDIAFERIRRADPARILKVMERLPGFKLITTHLGAWEQWDEVSTMLIGKPIYMELSFAVECLGSKMKALLEAHPKDYLLFGSDSPWTGQKETLGSLKALGLEAELEEAILYGNARRLLGL